MDTDTSTLRAKFRDLDERVRSTRPFWSISHSSGQESAMQPSRRHLQDRELLCAPPVPSSERHIPFVSLPLNWLRRTWAGSARFGHEGPRSGFNGTPLAPGAQDPSAAFHRNEKDACERTSLHGLLLCSVKRLDHLLLFKSKTSPLNRRPQQRPRKL